MITLKSHSPDGAVIKSPLVTLQALEIIISLGTEELIFALARWRFTEKHIY